MPNFKVGDIVRGIDSSRYQCTNSDMTKGKVTYIRSDGYFDCIILEHKHPEKASCEIGCEHTYLDPKYFKLVPKFAVGQIYKVGIPCFGVNAVIKITEVNGNSAKYKLLKGEINIGGSGFDFNSIFGKSLTLLTGKEIGEAIKAFDEKKTGGVEEVKRRAKKGEYLKVVDASTDEGYNYSNGDILKCTFVGSCGIQARSGAKYGTLVDHEYAVLEGYKPENNGRIYIGGKHVWTPEEVERAKTIVLDTIREIYEESKGSVVFSRDVDSDKIFDAYLIEKGYSKLGYRPLDDAVIAHKARKGTAKCSPTDEPNVWIGKCVALCKALHKPIPSFIMGD